MLGCGCPGANFSQASEPQGALQVMARLTLVLTENGTPLHFRHPTDRRRKLHNAMLSKKYFVSTAMNAWPRDVYLRNLVFPRCSSKRARPAREHHQFRILMPAVSRLVREDGSEMKVSAFERVLPMQLQVQLPSAWLEA